MKTAISIPDEVFQQAERLAKRAKKSRSQLFSDAMRDYAARHAPDEVAEAVDRVCADVNGAEARFVSSASLRILKRSEW